MSRNLHASVVLAVTLGCGQLVGPAAAQCPSPLGASPNTVYPIHQNDYLSVYNAQPRWVAVGVLAFRPTDDYDITVYRNGYGSPAPVCFSDVLASSAYNAGASDFVVGDFNFNPAGGYFVRSYCYSGDCANPLGLITYSSGGQLDPDTGPVTVTVVPGTSSQPNPVKIWDVYLYAGFTYYFGLTQTGALQSQLMLFRNPGGEYWAGRSAAVVQTAGCATYAPPSTGWYGLVVVNDRASAYTESYTVEVKSSPVCACSPVLEETAPYTLSTSPPAQGFLAPVGDWSAVGIRSFSDWDLVGGTTAATPPGRGCVETAQATSQYGTGLADMIAFSRVPGTLLNPAQQAVRAYLYSGPDAATFDYAGSPPEALVSGGAPVTRALESHDVVAMATPYLEQGKTYTFLLDQYGVDGRMLLYPLLGGGLHSFARSQALFESPDRATYTATATGFHGLAIVKDDWGDGFARVRFGEGCAPPETLAAGIPKVRVNVDRFLTYDQQTPAWAAVGVLGTDDWDIQAFESPTGSLWPVCFGGPGAGSFRPAGVDFVVGDFRHDPPGPQFVRANRASMSFVDSPHSLVQWDPSRGILEINGPSVGGQLSDQPRTVLWCWEVVLQAGRSYDFIFDQPPGGAFKLMLFHNPGSGGFSAPRAAADFEVGDDHTFVAPVDGVYAVVVTGDSPIAPPTDDFTLRVNSAIVDAAVAAIARTELTALVPNPTRGHTRVEYALAQRADVTFEVLDLGGRRVAWLAEGARGAGRHSVTWDGRAEAGGRVAPGLYFVRMNAGGREVATRRVTLVE